MSHVIGTAGNDLLEGGVDNDTLVGGAGDDVLLGGDGGDLLVGGEGFDTLDGGEGADTYLVGDGENFDTYQDSGASGEDRILASNHYMAINLRSFGAANGIEEISANGKVSVFLAGDDAGNLIDFSTTRLVGIQQINGLGGNDTITGSAGDDHIGGGAGDDVLAGGDGADTLEGGAGADTLDGGDGGDVLLGGGGDDRLEGSYGDDVLDGGDGSDTYAVWSGDGIDTYHDTGTSGVDRILASSDDVILTMASFGAANGIEEIDADEHVNVVIAGDDADNVLDFSATSLVGIARIDGGKGHNTITGSAADDRIIGGNGFDRFDGGAGADTLDGGSGVDTLIGGAGNDVLLGGALGDRLEGGTGNDFLDGGAGADTYLVGSGDGFDTYQDSGTDGAFDWILVTSDNVTLTMASFGLATGIEQINAGGHAGVTIEGDGDANVLDFSETIQLTTLVGIAEIDGGGGDDTITGSASDDRIVGGKGNDVLAGGLGDDTLDGGVGNEVLFGGAGSDTFVFTSYFNDDKIVDFQVGEDVIEFSTNFFADYAAVQAASSQIGANVEIDAGDNSITLYNVQLAMLSAQDFLFV